MAIKPNGFFNSLNKITISSSSKTKGRFKHSNHWDYYVGLCEQKPPFTWKQGDREEGKTLLTTWKVSPANKPVLTQCSPPLTPPSEEERHSWMIACWSDWQTRQRPSPIVPADLNICWWQHVCLARRCPAFLWGPPSPYSTHMSNYNKTQSEQTSSVCSFAIVITTHFFKADAHIRIWVLSGSSL